MPGRQGNASLIPQRVAPLQSFQVSSAWSNLDHQFGTLLDIGGTYVKIKDLDAIWWRRVNSPQRVSEGITHDAYIDLINNDCRFALYGLIYNDL
ncbi:MAG: hypothetical protein WAM14_18655 [Candidatus Nitrosopolaris sp.]